MRRIRLKTGPAKFDTSYGWPAGPSDFVRRIVDSDPSVITNNLVLENFFSVYNGSIKFLNYDDKVTKYQQWREYHNARNFDIRIEPDREVFMNRVKYGFPYGCNHRDFTLVIPVGYIEVKDVVHCEAYQIHPLPDGVLLAMPLVSLVYRYADLPLELVTEIINNFGEDNGTQPFNFNVIDKNETQRQSVNIRVWASKNTYFRNRNENLTISDMVNNIENGLRATVTDRSCPYEMDLRVALLHRDRPSTYGLSELSKVRVVLALDNNTRSMVINQHRLDVATDAGILTTSEDDEPVPARTFWGGRMTAPTGGQSDADEEDETDRCRIRRVNKKARVEYNASVVHETRHSKKIFDELHGIKPSEPTSVLSNEERLKRCVLSVPRGKLKVGLRTIKGGVMRVI